VTVSDERRYFELRAEWLKLKGLLVDPGTGLPALPAVIEEVRRRIEAGDAVGIIYLNLAGDDHYEASYGWEAYEDLIHRTAGALQDLRGGLLAPQDVLALLGARGDEFVVFVSDAAADRVLDERGLEERRQRLAAGLAGRLDASGPPPWPGIESAASLVRAEPTVRLERAIYRALDAAKHACRRARAITARRKELRHLLDAHGLEVRYQPIVHLGTGAIHGFEALSRGPQGGSFANPEQLFSFAEQTHLIRELERSCRLESIRGIARRAAGQKLFVNCTAHSFSDPELLAPSVVDLARGVGLGRGDVVVEITERAAITEWKDVLRVVRRLRKAGCFVAIDDVGSGYSSLKSVAELEPEYLKFDVSLVRGIHTSPIKRNLLETLATLAQRIGATAVAEGVESEADLEVVRGAGVPLGQGYLFGPPDALSRYVPA
jgi:EAL domain-containing protein (putative c-di-GMP-specific phosphodiesterase class I)